MTHCTLACFLVVVSLHSVERSDNQIYICIRRLIAHNLIVFSEIDNIFSRLWLKFYLSVHKWQSLFWTASIEGWNLKGDFIGLFAWLSQFTTIIILIECSRVEKSNLLFNTINYCKPPKWCLLIQFTSETKNNAILMPRKTAKKSK